MRLFFLLLCMIVSGCSVYRIDSQDTTLDFYPPKSSPAKVVYLEKVEQPYEVIGIVTVDTDRSRPFRDVIEQMRQEASVLGGDAIMDVRSGPAKLAQGPSQSGPITGKAGMFVTHTAKVIVFK